MSLPIGGGGDLEEPGQGPAGWRVGPLRRGIEGHAPQRKDQHRANQRADQDRTTGYMTLCRMFAIVHVRQGQGAVFLEGRGPLPPMHRTSGRQQGATAAQSTV
jgi:hypothetical protein